ncbi:MAG: YkgJ family cysteine cluster protein [Gammaproteobacteria bacterium]|nr:YkgJ family cysteine cluster protein [Gammaproteobacteria bacterium]
MFKRTKPSAVSQAFETSYSELMDCSPHEALIAFHARHDRLIEQVVAQSDQTRACEKECNYCCYFKVVVDAVEVFAMVDFVKAELDEQLIEQIIQSAKRNIEEAKNLSHEEHATINQQCPLLVDNACAIYPVRSIKCRNFHAIDDSSCRASYENPRDLTILNNHIPALYVAATGSSDGFMAALHTHGYDDRIYDFNAAFIEAMENPDCKRRYDTKKRAFTTVKYNNA